MAFLEGKTPAERRNVIILLVLGSIVLLAVIYNFVLTGSKPKGKSRNRSTAGATSGAANETVTTQEIRANQAPRPVIYQPADFRSEPTIGRNIFAYHTGSGEARPSSGTVITNASPVTTDLPTPVVPTPVPPSLILAGVSPSNIMGRSGDFALEVTGDKFTPESRIYFDGGELPTTFENQQRLRTRVPAALISSPGNRSIIVRTPDGSLFSNTVNFNVLPPPVPQYTYVGLLRRKVKDTAVLMNGKKELLSYQRGDIIDGRFRLTDISERTVELTDTELSIKHTLPFVETRNNINPLNNRPQRPISPPPVNDDQSDGDNN